MARELRRRREDLGLGQVGLDDKATSEEVDGCCRAGILVTDRVLTRSVVIVNDCDDGKIKTVMIDKARSEQGV